MRIMGYDADLTKREGLEMFVTALIVTGIVALVSALLGGIPLYAFIAPIIAFPLGMLVFKFFSTAKGLTGTEWGAGFIRGGIFLLLGLLFGMIQLQTMICGVNELCGNIYLWWFAIAMITGIISEFTIDPLLGLD